MAGAQDQLEADLVVVGGGGAGLAACLEGARRGLRVTLIEKAGKLGGTTALSVGTIMAAGRAQQKQAGIADSPETHAADLDRIRLAMGFDDDPALRQLLTENAADTVAFLRSAGINFLGPLPQPPHSIARMHQVMPTSRAYAFQLARAIRKLGVTVLLRTRATRLVTRDGRVVAVEGECDGRTVSVSARGGVIIASGDIGANRDMMYQFMGSWADGIAPYNPLNAGEGHAIAAAIGARIVPRKDLPAEAAAHIRFDRPPDIWLQRVPAYAGLTRLMIFALRVLPAALIRPFMMKFLVTTLGPDRGVYEQGAILVNKHGARFADERADPNLHIPKQPDGIAYIVFDARFARKFSQWPYFISTAPGVAFAYFDDYRRARPDLFHQGKTLAELAANGGFAADALAASVAEVNAARPDEMRLVEGPFYALGPVRLWVMVAPIGLAVNTQLEVLDEAGAPIPGLYAAGNAGQAGFTITGHGHGLGWAFTTGRLAARNIALAMQH